MTSVATPEVPTASAVQKETAVPAQTGHISLADIAKAHDVRFLLATFVDMTGKPCA
jgi:glutamine synthetase